jgi:hypothetical protein
MFFGSKAKQIDNAQTEGEDVPEREPEREQTRVPVPYDEVYRRLDAYVEVVRCPARDSAATGACARRARL